MTHLKLKLLVAALVFVGALSYLAYAGMKKAWVYTVSVDTYLTSTEYQDQQVRLCGTVAEEGVEVNKAQLAANFSLKGTSAVMPVAYHGVIPDMFKPGCEVIVEGRRDAAGVFRASTLMTKCASKYDEKPKNHPPVGKGA